MAALLLLAVLALAYLPAWNGQPIWDDNAHLTRAELRSWHGLAEIWTDPAATQQYYPLVHTVFWVENRLWGHAVLPYHLVNILLHFCAALLLFRLLERLRIRGAWLAAAIFALHPVQVESVAWISELKNTLSGVFYLSAALVYLRFDQARTRRSYFFALGLFSLGLLSKTVVAMLPPSLLVILWWRNGRLFFKRDLFPLLPLFIIGVAAGLFTAWIERTHIGASGGDFALSAPARFLVAGRVFWFYLSKLLWPVPLIFTYSKWEISTRVWWQYLHPLAALTTVAWVGWRGWRGTLAALLSFGVNLFPVLGFLNVFPFLYSYVADHFQYLASIGVIVLFAATVVAAVSRLSLRPTMQFALCTPLLLLLAILTFRQSQAYADAETLYRTTLRQNPASWMAQNNLANLLLRSARAQEAIDHYEAALRLRPVYLEAHYNLANALLQLGRVEESIAHCQMALTIDPQSAEARNNLGNALVKARRWREAAEEYQTALGLQPEAISTLNNLAWLYATSGDISLRDGRQAVKLADRAILLRGRPDDPLLLNTLAAAYAQSGDVEKALAIARRALGLADDSGPEALRDAIQKEIVLFEARLNKAR